MRNPVRIELTNNGLIDKLINHNNTRGALCSMSWTEEEEEEEEEDYWPMKEAQEKKWIFHNVLIHS